MAIFCDRAAKECEEITITREKDAAQDAHSQEEDLEKMQELTRHLKSS